MTISEVHHQPCGEWRVTPTWLQWLGKQPYRRALYAWAQIGGGWDGWEYGERPSSEGMPVVAAYIDQPWRDSAWVGMSASERACYDWPEDTDLHRQCRAAYIAGATDYAVVAR